jgi:glycerophosphoryl diester phosphodiesterase
LLVTRPLLLGHRGARAVKSIPENTIASFDRALADGCDGFEFDVRQTRDGIAVVFHDAKMGLIKIAHANAERLSHLPRLEDVLTRYQNTAFLNVELKVPGLDDSVLKLLRQHPPARGCVVSSFLPEVIEALRARDQKIRLGLICEKDSQLTRWSELPVEYVMLSCELASPAMIRELKTANKKVFVWTVNESDEMRRFAKLGVDGIISDETELLCRTLQR